MHPACGEVHEIENVGRFPANLSPQRLTAEEASANDNTSLPPNPDIANVMFIGGLIEHWGRGLSMMNNKCKNVGLPKPKINDNGYMVKVIFARPQNGEINGENDRINDRIKPVLDLLAENPYITLPEVALQLKYSDSKVNRIIAELRKLGLLTREGSNKTGRWIVKRTL